MKKWIVTALALMGAATANAATVQAPAGLYKIDPTHASITWKVNHMGLSNYTARFTKFDASLNFQPDNLEDSKIEVTIDPTSVQTDYPNPEKEDFNKKIGTDANFLNAGKFSKITFTSTKIVKTSESSGKVTGDLTMLGVTKPVTLDVKFNGSMKEHPFTKGGALGFSGSTTIKRSDWGMTYGTPHVGDDVKVEIEAEFMEEK